MEKTVDPDEKSSRWIVRFFVLLIAISWCIDLLGLQTRYAIFTDGTGWLAAVRFDSWAERCGLALILGIFSMATSGIWILLLLAFSKLFRRDRFRTLAIGTSIWIIALIVHLILRQEVYEYFRDAFDFADYKESAGGLWAMLEDIWNWFGTIILLGLGGCLVFGGSLFFGFRLLRKWSSSWGWVDRLSGKGIIWITSVSLLLSILLLTLFSHRWRLTRQMVQKTWVGLPLAELVLLVTDVDMDGYSPFGDPADTAPFDPDRHPYAVDFPGDNVDQDLLLGDFLVKNVAEKDRLEIEKWFSYPPVSFTNRKNIIVVTLESFRFDAFESRLDGREVTPRLNQAAREGGVVVPNVYSTRGFTINSMEQISWGGFYNPGTTLLDDFRENDYSLGAFCAYDFEKREYRSRMGFTPGEVLFRPRDNMESNAAGRVFPHMEKWIRSRKKGNPFFLYAHFEDPHYPYTMDNNFVFCDEFLPANRFTRELAEPIRRQYLNQVYAVDQVCGKLLDLLRDTGLRENTIVIFISDHGESIFDDGIRIGHGTRINEVMTHCFMLVMNSTSHIPGTLSHYDIRSLVRTMLTTPPVDSPRVLPVPDNKILHYLYTIDEPTFLGEYSDAQGRLVYDVEENWLRDERSGEEGLFQPGAISEDLFQRGSRLIYRWEFLKVMENRGKSTH